MKYETGMWVEVTVTRIEQPSPLVLTGKIVEATRDYAVAECRTADGPVRFKWDGHELSTVSFRRMTGADWQARRRARR